MTRITASFSFSLEVVKIHIVHCGQATQHTQLVTNCWSRDTHVTLTLIFHLFSSNNLAWYWLTTMSSSLDISHWARGSVKLNRYPSTLGQSNRDPGLRANHRAEHGSRDCKTTNEESRCEHPSGVASYNDINFV